MSGFAQKLPLTPALSPRAGRGRDPRSGRVRGRTRGRLRSFTGGKPMQTVSPGAAVSPHLAVRQDWLDRRREEIIEPDLPIVDPHHHLVDRPETGRYLPPALLADLRSGHNVTATVYLAWLSMY